MKLKSLATIAVAVLAMAAAPPRESGGGRRSTWGSLVDGVKAFAHNPFGLARRGTRHDAQSPNRAAPAMPTHEVPAAQRTAPRSMSNVRQATSLLPESKATSGRGKALPVKRATLFSRSKRRARSISEYMAQEKP